MKSIIKGMTLSMVALLASCASNPTGEYIYHYKDLINYEDTGTLNFDNDGNVIFDNVEINFRTIVNACDAEGLEAIVNKFNVDNQGKIKINFSREGQGSFYTTLTRQIAQNNNVPDLTMFHVQNLPGLQDSHLFQPVDRILEKAHLSYNKSDYYDGCFEDVIIGDKQYGLPIDGHSEVILYRKDLLNKYNVKTPTDYNSFVSACQAIEKEEKKTNPSFRGLALTDQAFGFYQFSFYTAFLQNGGEIAASRTRCPEWTSEENMAALIKAAQQFRGFFFGENAIADKGLTEVQPDAVFANGNTAFSFVYTWNLKDTIEAFKASHKSITDDEIGIMPLSGLFNTSKSNPNKNKLFAMTHCFTIPYTIKDINKKAAAMYFSKWLCENATPWCNTGHVTMNKNVENSEEYKSSSYYNYVLQYFGKPENMVNFPNTPYFTQIDNALSQLALTFVEKEDVNIEEAIIASQEGVMKKIRAIQEDE